MSVWNRFTIEIYKFMHSLHTFLACAAQMYGFTHSLHTFLVCAAHGAIAIEDSEDRFSRLACQNCRRFTGSVCTILFDTTGELKSSACQVLPLNL